MGEGVYYSTQASWLGLGRNPSAAGWFRVGFGSVEGGEGGSALLDPGDDQGQGALAKASGQVWRLGGFSVFLRQLKPTV